MDPFFTGLAEMLGLELKQEESTFIVSRRDGELLLSTTNFDEVESFLDNYCP